MTENAIEAEYKESTAIAVAPQANANAALFGTDDPEEVIAKASRIATALCKVIDAKRLYKDIQGKKHIYVEAWQTMGAMMNINAVCEWTHPIENGFESRVVLYRNGQIIGAAEAQCDKTERSKKTWDDYALRSMAQTRATSKAYRSNLAFVVVLGGYEATPAEEMPNHDPAPKPPDAPSTGSLMKLAVEAGLCIDTDTFRDWVRKNVIGCETLIAGTLLTPEQRLAIADMLP